MFPASKVVNPKVIYIPAERNFVSVVPNLQKYTENDDNLMDFLLSWQEARKKYPTSHKLVLLNLGMNFYSQYGVSSTRWGGCLGGCIKWIVEYRSFAYSD